MCASLVPAHPPFQAEHLLGALSHRGDQSRTARVLPRNEKHFAAEGFEAVGPLFCPAANAPRPSSKHSPGDSGRANTSASVETPTARTPHTRPSRRPCEGEVPRIQKLMFCYCLPGASALGIRGHQGASGSCFLRLRGHQGHLTGHQGFQNLGFVDPWPGELGIFKIKKTATRLPTWDS